MSEPVRLTTALTPLRQHGGLLDGSVPVAGAELDVVAVPRYVEIFRRMARDQEFDVCEFSVMSYLTARDHGLPFSALPIFPRHRFQHGDFRVNRHAGIHAPADLAGRRVGTRSWTVTPGVWDRGILSDDFGIAPAQLTWVLGEEEHVAACDRELPTHVQAPDGRSLFDRLCAGELDAGIAGVAPDGAVDPDVVPLFGDPAAMDRDQFARTGVLPVFTLIAVHERVLAGRPDLPQSLYDAFGVARRRGVDSDRSVLAVGPDDPSPVGLDANGPAVRMLVRLAVEQQILHRTPTLAELFLPVG